MTQNNEPPTVTPVGVDVLDRLIRDSYESLLKEMKDKPKIGDLLRMIELRRKLLPREEDQKQFWAMLDKIRLSVPPSDDKSRNKMRITQKKTSRRKRETSDA